MPQFEFQMYTTWLLKASSFGSKVLVLLVGNQLLLDQQNESSCNLEPQKFYVLVELSCRQRMSCFAIKQICSVGGSELIPWRDRVLPCPQTCTLSSIPSLVSSSYSLSWPPNATDFFGFIGLWRWMSLTSSEIFLEIKHLRSGLDFIEL
jgi:hypothetical protein